MQAGKDDLILLARMCERASRNRSMCDIMTQFVESGFELSKGDRELFAEAFRKSIYQFRKAWQALRAIENEFTNANNRSQHCAAIQAPLECRIRELAEKGLALIDGHILPACTAHEPRVYFFKLQGDLRRYMCEVAHGTAFTPASDAAMESYRSAADIALCFLAPTNPTRLSLMMNLSVFYYEILTSPERACALAKSAYDDAIEAGLLDKRTREQGGQEYEEAMAVMHMMQDNLRRWTAQLSPQSSYSTRPVHN